MAVFQKNNATSYPDALMKEANGLNILRQALSQTSILVPEVFLASEDLLEIETINSQSCTSELMTSLGKGLAELHKQFQPFYGYHENNYIGLNPQPNKPSENWGEFFIIQRLGFQVSLIKDAGNKHLFQHILSDVQKMLENYLNQHCEFPSLVHGDLWSGNYLCDAENVWLIDPAVYFADREVDLAMTEMFGGFSQEFYQAYDQAFPRTEAYDQKKVIYNLYHYLNHYNLFGDSYLPSCQNGFNRLQDWFA